MDYNSYAERGRHLGRPYYGAALSANSASTGYSTGNLAPSLCVTGAERRASVSGMSMAVVGIPTKLKRKEQRT